MFVSSFRTHPPAPSLFGDFANVTQDATDAFAPEATAGQAMVLYLHGSGTDPVTFGTHWHATMRNNLDYPAGSDSTMYWAARWNNSGSGGAHYIQILPRDRHPDQNNTNANLNSFHMGWTDGAFSPRQAVLITERRMDQLLAWVESQYPQASTTKRYMNGDSVGAWACMTYGIRRPTKFAALYPSRPRFRYDANGAQMIQVPDWNSSSLEYNLASVSGPNKSAIDGGGTMASHLDITSYVADTANRIPWVGWVIGSADTFVTFQDHKDFIAAMRTAKRGFAVSWNAGNHSGAPNISDITDSYYYGLFEVGVGYPLYENNSGDQDPAVDAVGGINLGFKHRSVVESAGAWSCEITNTLGARTVDVSPISSIYTGSLTPKNKTIPSANTWVSVAFP
jgi:hypothetical protein